MRFEKYTKNRDFLCRINYTEDVDFNVKAIGRQRMSKETQV